MTLTPAQVLRGLVIAGLAIAWAVAAHLGSAGAGHPDVNAALAVSPIVAAIAMMLWRLPRALAIPGLLALGGALAGFWPTLRENVAALYFVQHVGINLALAALFGRSLLGPGEALITHIARVAFGGDISARKARYTRQVTIAWTLFFVANAALSSLLFVALPIAGWSVFANLLGAPLIGAMFLAEHIWRQRVLPPEERPSLAMVVRAWRARSSTPNA